MTIEKAIPVYEGFHLSASDILIVLATFSASRQSAA